MSFSDDELPPDISSSAAVQGDRVRLVAYSNKEAPLEENTQQVLLEIIDMSSPVERAGLDLVAVLDVSVSMNHYRKLDKVKTAMKFVISKLGPNDRLSIVSFSDDAKKWCPLLCMTGAAQEKLKGIVDNLIADGYTNREDGLKAGLNVLARRRHTGGRVGSIILMSDGAQFPGDASRDARTVNIGNVAVYTFGFGEDSDAKVMEAIASKSQGGTFSFVRDGESLSEHFSQILAGLLSVVVQDLKLTVWQQDGYSQIDKDRVHAYGYPPEPGENAGSVTVSFGYMYSGEGRKVIVDLLLPAVDREYPSTTVLLAQCRYRTQGKDVYFPRDYLRCDMRRTVTARPDVIKPQVKNELVRRRHADTLKQVSELGEKDFHLAKHKLEEAKKDLDAEQSSNPRLTMIHILRAELLLLLSQVVWKEFMSCLLASWTSHHLQRFAARGNVRGIRMFITPLMVRYLGQAIDFDENPNMILPSVEEDAKEEAEIVRKRGQPVADHHPRVAPRIWAVSSSPGHRSCGWTWRAVIIVLAIALIVAGAVVFAVYLLYKPKTPYLVVSDARLVQLQYGKDGAIKYLRASVTILAENNNSKAGAAFSSVDLALAFHGADVALLHLDAFVVAPKSSLSLQYDVVSAGTALDAAGMQAMDEALKAGIVPLDLISMARTQWKVGVFVKVKFWTRISCHLRFFFPGNGTVMPDYRQKCRSKSP